MGADEQPKDGPKDGRERPTEASPLLRQDPRVPEARSSCGDAPAVVLVRKGANERIGVDLNGGGAAPLILARVGWKTAAKRCGAGEYVGWQLTLIEGLPVNSIADVREAGAGRTQVALTFEIPSMPTPQSSDDEGSVLEDEHPKLAPEDDEEAAALRAREGKKEKPVRPKGEDSISARYAMYIWFLLGPVSVCMLLTVYSVVVFSEINDENTSSSVLPITDDTSTPGAAFGGALLNALLITGFILVVTFLFVLLYKYNCLSVLLGWLLLSTVVVLLGASGIWLERFCVRYQIPLDYVSFVVIMANVTVVGICCIYYHGHPSLTRAYHVFSSAVVAWFLTRMPEWTTWCLLFTVAVYDIFAVCCGPLKTLVEESQSRQQPIPALVYESRRYKLGLGDFIFYSVLVGRAAVFGYVPWVASFIAVIAGLCLTLFALATLKVPLPALPCSIFLGIAAAFSSRYILMPYALQAAVDSVYV
ncbi:Presenilin-B [Diplonema papillatum]|nr:Presenilin-B [Diplonema papillatum]